jgi:hypothetical protein
MVFSPNYRPVILKYVSYTLFIFRPESVAKGMIHLIEKGSSGSIWVAEGGQPVYEVQTPDRQSMRVE